MTDTIIFANQRPMTDIYPTLAQPYCFLSLLKCGKTNWISDISTFLRLPYIDCAVAGI